MLKKTTDAPRIPATAPTNQASPSTAQLPAVTQDQVLNYRSVPADAKPKRVEHALAEPNATPLELPSRASLPNLPDELLLGILKRLETSDMVKVARTSRQLSRIALSKESFLAGGYVVEQALEPGATDDHVEQLLSENVTFGRDEKAIVSRALAVCTAALLKLPKPLVLVGEAGDVGQASDGMKTERASRVADTHRLLVQLGDALLQISPSYQKAMSFVASVELAKIIRRQETLINPTEKIEWELEGMANVNSLSVVLALLYTAGAKPELQKPLGELHYPPEKITEAVLRLYMGLAAPGNMTEDRQRDAVKILESQKLFGPIWTSGSFGEQNAGFLNTHEIGRPPIMLEIPTHSAELIAQILPTEQANNFASFLAGPQGQALTRAYASWYELVRTPIDREAFGFGALAYLQKKYNFLADAQYGEIVRSSDSDSEWGDD